MYLAVTAIIVGQALMFGNVRLLAHGALVLCLFHAFVLVYEEPTLTAGLPGRVRRLSSERPALDTASSPLAGGVKVESLLRSRRGIT